MPFHYPDACMDLKDLYSVTELSAEIVCRNRLQKSSEGIVWRQIVQGLARSGKDITLLRANFVAKEDL